MENFSRGVAWLERMIYFDHNSTTPYSPSVREYIETGFTEDWENPSAIYLKALGLHQKIRNCRTTIAQHLNCSSKYIFFTNGGTESINTVLSLETLKLNKVSTIVSSKMEHHATLKKTQYLSQHQNIQSCWVRNNTQGEIDLSHLDEICSQHPQSLLTFLSANNETGVITDVKSIVKIAKKHNCLVHIDAVQLLGKALIDLEDCGVDFASFSGHKIGAMKGIGLLYARRPFAPLMHGGGQERGLRAGTYNYPAIHSFKLAVEDIDLTKQEYIESLRDYLENQLDDSCFTINCEKSNRLVNTSSIHCDLSMSNQAILLNLFQKNICVSSGSACNTGSPEPSHVIIALGIKKNGSCKDYANACLRVSLSSSNTKEELDFLVDSLKELHSLNLKSDRQPIQN